MDIPKLLSFIFGYFFIFRNNRPKITHLPTPSNSTNILPLRPLIHLPSERRTARHGIRRNSGRVNGRLNRYNPFRPYQNNFICVSVNTATTASTLRSQLSNVANFSGVGFRWQRRWLCRICFTISAKSFAVIFSGFSICGAFVSSAI